MAALFPGVGLGRVQLANLKGYCLTGVSGHSLTYTIAYAYTDSNTNADRYPS